MIVYLSSLKTIVVLIAIFPILFIFQNCSNQQVQFSLLPDQLAPVAMELASDIGDSNSRNKLKIRIKASDDISGIARVCLIKSYVHENPPNQPTENDPCWVKQQRPFPTEINTDFNFFMGFLPTSYYVYVFLMDDVGRISSLSAFGNGILGKDKILYNLNPLTPPKLLNVQMSISDQEPLNDSKIINVLNNDKIYLKWKAQEGAVALVENPIRVLLKIENNNWQELVSNLKNDINGQCSISSDHTGCVVLGTQLFKNKSFKIKVELNDLNNVKSVVSVYGNSGQFKLAAGNLESGHGASASSSVFLFNQNPLTADKNIFVVSNTGFIYIRDSQKGLLQVEPNSGNVEILIPQTGKIYDGNLSQATIAKLESVYIDHSDRIYFYDLNRLRRFNPENKTVETVLGGGQSREDGILGSHFSLLEFSRIGTHFAFLPNDELVFTDSINFSTQEDYFFKMNLKTFKIQRIPLSGSHFYNNTEIDFTLNKSGYPFYISGGFGIEYNLSDSKIKNMLFRVNGCYNIGCGYSPHSTLVDYSTGRTLPAEQQNMNAPDVFPAMYNGFIHGLNGKIYFINKGLSSNISQLYVLNSNDKKWETVFQGEIGNCEDGSNASFCKSRIEDAFINRRGEIYFFDGGVIRTVGPNNKVYTIYGQKRFFGDGLHSMNARFSEINSFGINHKNEIVILDSAEGRIRSVDSKSLIVKNVAGNSEVTADIGDKKSIETGLKTDYWGARYQMHVSNKDGTIYFSNDVSFSKLNYDSGYWQTINKGPRSQSYFTLKDIPFSDVAFGYPPIMIGLNHEKFLFITGNWDGSRHIAGMVRSVDLINYNSQHFLGSVDYDYNGQTTFLPESDVGVTRQQTKVNAVQFGNSSGILKYSSNLNSWIGLSIDKRSLMRIRDNEPIQILIKLPRAISSFSFREVSYEEIDVFYCDQQYRKIYKFNSRTKVETILPTPVDVKCTGFDMHYDSIKNRLLFPVYEDVSQGIAEIRD